MKTIELGCFGIIVGLAENGGGTISSDLRESADDAQQYNAAMNAIECLILAHACAGIDITTPAYIEGIETTVQACAYNL